MSRGFLLPRGRLVPDAMPRWHVLPRRGRGPHVLHHAVAVHGRNPRGRDLPGGFLLQHVGRLPGDVPGGVVLRGQFRGPDGVPNRLLVWRRQRRTHALPGRCVLRASVDGAHALPRRVLLWSGGKLAHGVCHARLLPPGNRTPRDLSRRFFL